MADAPTRHDRVNQDEQKTADSTEWMAEAVMLPNGSSVIVPKKGVRGVPSLLPLPPRPDGVTVDMRNIHMRRKRLRNGKRIVIATLNRRNAQAAEMEETRQRQDTVERREYSLEAITVEEAAGVPKVPTCRGTQSVP